MTDCQTDLAFNWIVIDIGRAPHHCITDPRTGNSCWGQATVEDKMAPILTYSS
ncbi:MAG: hypothetical protein IPO62_16595 [Saprospiraceae bacterium]|nr:hypothetical protein [Saprospiraceae bacterium]